MTRIYAGAPYQEQDMARFHAAVDGQGRTFSLILALPCETAGCILSPAILGGYNPQSWSSTDGEHRTFSDAERTAFIFNLTDGRIYRQLLEGVDDSYGNLQTQNEPSLGPAFGQGDLCISIRAICSSASYGRASTGHYGPGANMGLSIAGPNSSSNQSLSLFTPFIVEVFTIESVAVPEPGTGLMAAGALAAVLLLRRISTRR